MSDAKVPQEFWDRADEFITLANKQAGTAQIGQVSASLMFAASRFNSSGVIVHAESAAEMEKYKEQAVTYFRDQFRKMSLDNLEDQIRSLDKHRGYKGSVVHSKRGV